MRRVRGTCARVAKAIFGQQAGAAGVVMVNNADGYPPYEGPITANPDTGIPYTVTIPFLGVPAARARRSSPRTAVRRRLDEHDAHEPRLPEPRELQLVGAALR